MIRTILVLVFFTLCVLLVMPWLFLWTLLTGNPDLMYAASMKGVWIGARVAGIRVRTEGLENIPPGPCVLTANHVSNADGPLFIASIRRRAGIMIKQEVFRIPILGSSMRRAQFIPVNRADREAAATSLEAGVGVLTSGVPLAVFPEGTRSIDARLHRFKTGAFAMAIQAGVPVVPVSIVGTQPIMKKGSWIVRPGEVVIRFGPHVNASKYPMNRRAELAALVESRVAAGLPPNQQPTPHTRRASRGSAES